MPFEVIRLRTLAAAAALCAAGASQAAITFVSSAAAPPFNSATRDTFSDLTINTQLASFSVARTAGSFSYALTSTVLDAANSGLYVVPAASTVAVSTGWFADALVFTLATPARSFGGNFFGTNALGEVSSGALTLVATDINGLSATTTIAGNSLTAFTGVVSDVALSAVRVSIASPNTGVFASADNLAFSAAVPEPQSWALMLAGGAVMLRLAARRRA